MSRTIVNVVLLILSIGLAVCGQLCMKAGMNRVGEITSEKIKQPFVLIKDIVKSVWAVVGVLLYAVSAIFWLIVLSRVDLSVAYPMVAAGYVFVVFYSWIFFGERVKWFTWVGLFLIVVGVIVTGFGLQEKEVKTEELLNRPAVKVVAETSTTSGNNIEK